MSTILNKEAIQYDTYVTMETIICYKCAIPFGVPSNYRQHLRNTGDTFYCPNGHSQVYSKPRIKSLEEQLKAKEKEFEDSKKWLWNIIDSKNETIGAISRQKSAIKGQLTKVKKRIQHGVCPCCNRTFKNLSDHMKIKHPDYGRKQ